MVKPQCIHFQSETDACVLLAVESNKTIESVGGNLGIGDARAWM